MVSSPCHLHVESKHWMNLFVSLQFITWMHCCIDKELESKLQIKLQANRFPSIAQHHWHEQQPRSFGNLIVAIVDELKENGCLKVNVVNRIIPISSVTSTTPLTSTATCLRLVRPSPTQSSQLNVVNSHMNRGIDDTILWMRTASATIMFLPLHQQTHCQTMNATNVTIEMQLRRRVAVNGVVDTIAPSSMCTNQTKQPATIVKLVDVNAMCATHEIVDRPLDQCKAIKLKTTTNDRRRSNGDSNSTERPNQINANTFNGHRRHRSYQTNCIDRSDDQIANAFTSVRETSAVTTRRQLQTVRRRQHSKLPNKFTIVNALYIEYRKMFCTFLLPLLLFLCNLTPSIHAGEYQFHSIQFYWIFFKCHNWVENVHQEWGWMNEWMWLWMWIQGDSFKLIKYLMFFISPNKPLNK